MDEKETTEIRKEDTAITPEDTGSKFETTPVIERAREEREKMEIATKARKEENDRTERIMAKRELGGMSEAGQSPVKPEEETPKAYNDRINKEISDGQHDD